MFCVLHYFCNSCLEYDECDAGDNNCTQICTDTRKGYTCSCQDGFYLDVDNATCLGKSGKLEVRRNEELDVF